METLPQRIVCAALRLDGQIICGARHFDSIMHQQIALTGKRWNRAEQGFIDNKGNFLTREEAYIIAEKENQIRRICVPGSRELFSENLY